MVESKREAWHEIVKQRRGHGRDGVRAELRLPARHERARHGRGGGPGARVHLHGHGVGEGGRDASRSSSSSRRTSATSPARRARPCAGRRRRALAHQHHQLASMGVDLDTLVPHPNVGGMAAHGGYCGPAVKPIALNMVSELARDPEVNIPISRHRRHLDLARRGRVHRCSARRPCRSARPSCTTAIRIVEDMIDGLSNYLDEKGFATRQRPRRPRASPRVTDWGDLDLNYKTVARIDHEKCIGCNLCYVACEDGAHQCIPLVQLDGQALPRRGRARVRRLQPLLSRLPRRRAASRWSGSTTAPSRSHGAS